MFLLQHIRHRLQYGGHFCAQAGSGDNWLSHISYTADREYGEVPRILLVLRNLASGPAPVSSSVTVSQCSDVANVYTPAISQSINQCIDHSTEPRGRRDDLSMMAVCALVPASVPSAG